LLFNANGKKLKLTTEEEIIDEPPSTLKLLGLIKANNNISKRPIRKLFGKKKRKLKNKKMFFKVCEINGKKEVVECEVEDVSRSVVKRRKIK
jgi:hypothetical protein